MLLSALHIVAQLPQERSESNSAAAIMARLSAALSRGQSLCLSPQCIRPADPSNHIETAGATVSDEKSLPITCILLRHFFGPGEALAVQLTPLRREKGLSYLEPSATQAFSLSLLHLLVFFTPCVSYGSRLQRS